MKIRFPLFLTTICLLAAPAMAQQLEPSKDAPAEKPAPASKPRVFVPDSNSWEMKGSFGGSSDAFGGATHGGARPQTAEIIKTFTKECDGVLITTNKDRADYIVILEHEGGKGWIRKDNKFALSSKDGDVIAAGSTRSLGNSVKEACQAIKKQSKP